MAKRSSKKTSKAKTSQKNSSGKSRASQRRDEKKKEEQQRNLFIAAIALFVVAVIALIASAGGISPPPEVAAARLELDPILGADDAPVQIVEYGAYGCHACENFHNSGAIDRILADYDGQVNFTFRDFPVISPAYDTRSAQIAQCALDQSEDLFWDFHGALYEQHMRGANTASLLDLGGTLGLDREELATCYDERTHVATVDYDLDRAYGLGLNSTPSFLVNGERLFSPSERALRAAIDAALAS